MDCSYIVTVKDVGNITNDPDNIHTILTSTDNIQPRERVEVERYEPVKVRVRGGMDITYRIGKNMTDDRGYVTIYDDAGNRRIAHVDNLEIVA